MKIEKYGDVITVEDFWDCECDNDYIHRKNDESCPVCTCSREEMPDSMLVEVLAEFGDKLTREERIEMVYFLYLDKREKVCYNSL